MTATAELGSLARPRQALRVAAALSSKLSSTASYRDPPHENLIHSVSNSVRSGVDSNAAGSVPLIVCTCRKMRAVSHAGATLAATHLSA